MNHDEQQLRGALTNTALAFHVVHSDELTVRKFDDCIHPTCVLARKHLSRKERKENPKPQIKRHVCGFCSYRAYLTERSSRICPRCGSGLWPAPMWGVPPAKQVTK